MDKTPRSSSPSCNDDDGVPEATGMEKVLSDLNALKKLYGLLQRLDETSRALLKKLLDDATRQALLKQANVLATASDSVTPFSLGSASPKKMDQATLSSSSFSNNKEVEMEQILCDLQSLTRLYMLLHNGPTDENLDEASKALLMKILEDATQEAVRRQAKMLSGSQVPPALERKLSTRSDCRTQHADPRQRPLASPRPSRLASERSRQLNLQHSTLSSRSSLHANGRRHAAEEPPLARLASKSSSRTALPARHEEPPLARLVSKCSSRTVLPARHRPSQEQRRSSLSLQRSLMSRTSQHGTVTRGTRLANRQVSIHHSSGRGDQWSLERSSSSSSRRSMSTVTRKTRLANRQESIRRSSGRGDQWSPERSSSSSSRRSMSRESSLESSVLSTRTMSRHDVERVGRGVATPECSSTSNTMATIQSRIRPSKSLRVKRALRRSEEEGRASLKRHASGSDVSSAGMYSGSVSSGTRSLSSSAASLSASTSPTAPPPPRAFAKPYSYQPPPATATPKPRAFDNPYGYSPPPATASPKPRAFSTPYRYSPPPVTASPKPRAFAVPYFYSPPVTAPRGVAPPVYAPKVTRSMRMRRRQEVLAKRVERLRMLKEKIATVIHHLHDHHHHHHLGGGRDAAGPSSRSVVVRSAGHHLNSSWQFLTSMFHRAKGKVKNTGSRAVAGLSEKKRRGGGGGGDMHALFGAVWQHLKGKRRAPAGIKLRRTASWLRAKEMHWWQQLNRRRGVAGVTAGRPRRRLGHGKAGWL